MDPVVLGGLAAVLLIALVALLLGLRRGAHPTQLAQLAAGQAELSGRLSQMAEQGAASQTQLAERLQAQERELAKALEERLADLGRRVGETLENSTVRTLETMSDLRTRLAIIDQAQKTITDLSTQVVGLQDILSDKQARGAFGEVQLHDLVTAVLPPSAYAFQAALGGGRRVDCLLQLPNPPGPIAIDAKFPLESYRALRQARDEPARVQAARQFTADVRRHVVDIAQRYIVPGETAESALMFLPSEAVYAELHANFANVVEESYRRRVWIVSPTTLMATLNTVRAVLKDVRMREQAGVIQAEVRSLVKDVGRLDERVARLQRHFEQAGEDVRQIRISTEKVSRRGGRIEDLQLERTDTDHDLAPARASLAQD